MPIVDSNTSNLHGLLAFTKLKKLSVSEQAEWGKFQTFLAENQFDNTLFDPEQLKRFKELQEIQIASEKINTQINYVLNPDSEVATVIPVPIDENIGKVIPSSSTTNNKNIQRVGHNNIFQTLGNNTVVLNFLVGQGSIGTKTGINPLGVIMGMFGDQIFRDDGTIIKVSYFGRRAFVLDSLLVGYDFADESDNTNNTLYSLTLEKYTLPIIEAFAVSNPLQTIVNTSVVSPS